MKDEQIIALYFARNEDAIGETDKKIRSAAPAARAAHSPRPVCLRGGALGHLSENVERHSSAAPAGVSGFSQPFDAAGRHRPLSPATARRSAARGNIFSPLKSWATRSAARRTKRWTRGCSPRASSATCARSPPRERGVFLARYFYVDPLADVARQYGTSIGAVKSLLYRTRQVCVHIWRRALRYDERTAQRFPQLSWRQAAGGVRRGGRGRSAHGGRR